MNVVLKRVGDEISPDDGARVLVERHRPAELTDEKLQLAAWFPLLAPSAELLRWFGAMQRRWPLFRRRYLAELSEPAREEPLIWLHQLAANEQRVTLLTDAADPERSHAAILRDLIQGVRKPPATSGPVRAASGRMQARKPRP